MNQPQTSGAENGTSVLLNGESLLKLLFPDQKTRPSVFWLKKMRQKKVIPFYRVGKRVFFNAEGVRAALEKMEVRAAE